LLHILGNTTNAITAAWRELLDAGMYSNFPGFLFADTGARQNTNIFRIPPGGGAPVKTGGMPINQAIMPLPYKEPSQALMALVSDMAETGMRIGGTAEQQVGEGRADAPVGTTLAMIEQAAKVMNAVHKRMHAAQAQEFQLLIGCFKEHPESFWQRNRKPSNAWDEQTFLQALQDVELVPQADPNTASHGQRIMKIMALKQLQAAQPTLYNPIAIDKAALAAMGWSNPEQFMAPPEAQAAPPPEMQKAIAEIKIKQQAVDARTMTAQAHAAKAQAEVAQLIRSTTSNLPDRVETLHADDFRISLAGAQEKTALLQIDAGGVDSGGIDLPACLSCINTSCAAYVSQCNGDCVCKQGVADFVNCTQKNPSQFQQCGLQLYTNLQGTSAQAIGQGLVLCAGSKCPVCIPSDAGAPIVDAGGKG
jgi:hypothetical protein